MGEYFGTGLLTCLKTIVCDKEDVPVAMYTLPPPLIQHYLYLILFNPVCEVVLSLSNLTKTYRANGTYFVQIVDQIMVYKLYVSLKWKKMTRQTLQLLVVSSLHSLRARG